ncbi:transposase [Brevibacillus sp. NPDC003359]|uniref:transposase n=1 Tax=unclassified Brevibacillus TaxID=2684853 RepID=UPI0036D0C37A
MTVSMSRKGKCLDNACIEGFFSHLKTECLYVNTFMKDEEVQKAIKQYIHFYNNEHIQVRLNNLSPCAIPSSDCLVFTKNNVLDFENVVVD